MSFLSAVPFLFLPFFLSPVLSIVLHTEATRTPLHSQREHYVDVARYVRANSLQLRKKKKKKKL